MSFITSLSDVFKAVRKALSRPGVNIGETASYPRVELHSFVENAPTDKANDLRSIDLVIESLGEQSLGGVVGLVEGNLDALFSGTSLESYLTGWKLVGITPGVTRMLEEQPVQDQNIVLYRMLQEVTIWVERKAEA